MRKDITGIELKQGKKPREQGRLAISANPSRAGREGTAVQIGGAVSEQFCTGLRLNKDDRRLMLTAGIAAGFGEFKWKY